MTHFSFCGTFCDTGRWSNSGGPWEGAGKRQMRREERGREQKNAGSSGGTRAETGGSGRSTRGCGGTRAATIGRQLYGSTE